MSNNPTQATTPTRLIHLNDTVKDAIKKFQGSFWIDDDIYQKMEGVRTHSENYLHKIQTTNTQGSESISIEQENALIGELCSLLKAVEDKIRHKEMTPVKDGEPPHTEAQKESFSLIKKQSMDRIVSIIQTLEALSAGRS